MGVTLMIIAYVVIPSILLAVTLYLNVRDRDNRMPNGMPGCQPKHDPHPNPPPKKPKLPKHDIELDNPVMKLPPDTET